VQQLDAKVLNLHCLNIEVCTVTPIIHIATAWTTIEWSLCSNEPI